MDDASYFLVIRLGPKTSKCEKNVTVVSTVTGCDETNCATTLHGFNKHVLEVSDGLVDLDLCAHHPDHGSFRCSAPVTSARHVSSQSSFGARHHHNCLCSFTSAVREKR